MAHLARLCAAGFLRAAAVGMSGVLLGVYLGSVGWGLEQVGLLVSAGLAGTAVGTLLVSAFGDRDRRRALVVLGALQALGGVALLANPSPPVLLAAAFLGMVNGLGRDRGPAHALELAAIPETTAPERRTLALAWYGALADAGLAIGSLLAGVPPLVRHAAGWDAARSYRFAWAIYTVLFLATIVLVLRLSPRVEAAGSKRPRPVVSPASRRRIARLAALTGMDSLGGGFLSGALLSYWFFERCDVGGAWLGPLFFAARAANAGSHFAAAWLARRLGLLNTMVFTHIPSSLLLMLVPLAPTAFGAVVLSLVREALVEMDVPTRQSYVLAVVQPEERAFASGTTTLARNAGYAVAPSVAGAAMASLALSSPLFIGAGIKIIYDILLYASFRRVRPPEESLR